MKTTLWLTTFSMLLSAPLGFSKSELEILRSTVSEQERQIRQLEDENMKLRSLNGETVKAPAPVAPKAAEPVIDSASGTASYTIKSGDTLSKISHKTGASATTLAKLNGIKDPTKLRIGQKLKLPGEKSTTVASAPATSAPAAATGKETYIIRDGDTFYSIAKKHRISPESIADANPGIKASQLRTGQLIRLNSLSSPSPAAPAKSVETVNVVHQPAATPAPKQTVASAPPAAPAPAKSETPAKTAVHSVIIDGEMTYGDFATKHGTQIERLNELNGLDLTQSTVLAKGSELYVTAQP